MSIKMKVRLMFKVKRHGPTFDDRLRRKIHRRTTFSGLCMYPLLEIRAYVMIKRWAEVSLDY